MNQLTALAFGAAAVAALIDWRAVARGDERTERIAKPAVLTLLIVAALVADPASGPLRSLAPLTAIDTYSPPGPGRALLIAALAASLAGDWLLLPPVRFTAGLVAFLVAHLAYLAIFLSGALDPAAASLGVVLGALLLVTIGRRILAGARQAGMLAPVAAYFAVICLMAIAATGSGSLPAAVGAWLFATSDATLGWDRFAATPAVSPGGATRRRLAVIVTYHVAQFLLTASLLGAFAGGY